MRWSVLLALFAMLVTAGAARAAELELSSHKVLDGDPLIIRVVHARPGQRVTVHTYRRPAAAGVTDIWYGSSATFAADSQGVVDLSRDAPIDGDYEGVDMRGLFWSARRLGDCHCEEERVAAMWKAQVPTTRVGFDVALEEDGKVTDREPIEIMPALPDVRREDVRAGDLVGAFYSRPGMKKAPVVVVLSGSEGGLEYADWLGPKLASRGYAVFGLAYFDPEGKIAGVPTELNHIPVERLEQARAWLKTRREADIARFAVVGASRGGEFALVLGTAYRWIDAVVAFTPSDVVWQGFRRGASDGVGSAWSRGGVDLPYIANPYLRDAIAQGGQPGERIYVAPSLERSLAEATPQQLAAARIPIETSEADLLILGGADDRTGDSGDAALRMGDTLRAASYRHSWRVKSFANAGHSIVGTGWSSTMQHGQGAFEDGGDPQSDAEAEAQGWSLMLEVLAHALRPDKPPEGDDPRLINANRPPRTVSPGR
jgi:dienelactone hydrolase